MEDHEEVVVAPRSEAVLVPEVAGSVASAEVADSVPEAVVPVEDGSAKPSAWD